MSTAPASAPGPVADDPARSRRRPIRAAARAVWVFASTAVEVCLLGSDTRL